MKNRTNIQEELSNAQQSLNNTEFFGDAINGIVENQEAIVVTAFKMFTTLLVGCITVIIAVINIPFKYFSKEKF